MKAIVHFFGVCLFKPYSGGDGSISLYLPEAGDPRAGPYRGKHLDGDDAKAHNAYVCAEDRFVARAGGFQKVDTTYQLKLNGRVGEKCRSIVIPQPAGAFDKGALDRAPSFGTIADGVPNQGHGLRSAARLHMKGGKLSVALTDVDWKILDRVTSRPQSRWIPLGRIPYRVDWTLDMGDGVDTLTIRVYRNQSHGQEIGSLELKEAGGAPAELAIGNVDRLPSRGCSPTRTIDPKDCKDESGGTDRTCPDLDFKWFYRLFNEGQINRRRGGNLLPVPRIDDARRNVSASEAAKPGEFLGGVTPTCFPARG